MADRWTHPWDRSQTLEHPHNISARPLKPQTTYKFVQPGRHSIFMGLLFRIHHRLNKKQKCQKKILVILSFARFISCKNRELYFSTFGMGHRWPKGRPNKRSPQGKSCPIGVHVRFCLVEGLGTGLALLSYRPEAVLFTVKELLLGGEACPKVNQGGNGSNQEPL